MTPIIQKAEELVKTYGLQLARAHTYELWSVLNESQYNDGAYFDGEKTVSRKDFYLQVHQYLTLQIEVQNLITK